MSPRWLSYLRTSVGATLFAFPYFSLRNSASRRTLRLIFRRVHRRRDVRAVDFFGEGVAGEGVGAGSAAAAEGAVLALPAFSFEAVGVA